MRRIRGPLIALGVLVVVGLAAWIVAFSPWLAADEVSVTGERTVAEEQVLAAAHVDLGIPLVRLDLEAIRNRVAALAPVDSVSVHRSWPHTVSIDIREREPVAAVQHEGSWWVVDANGVLFGDAGTQQPSLPVIAMAAEAVPAERAEAATVVGGLPPELLDSLNRVTVRSIDSITLWLEDTGAVKWGSAEASDRKAEVLMVLLNQITASVYDVRVPEQPTTIR